MNSTQSTVTPPSGRPAQDFSFLRGKKIVITGGSGFVGSHLLPRLLEAGAELTCITRASSRTSRWPAAIHRVEADLSSGAGLAAALQGQDVLIHMAALLFGLGWQDYLRANAAAAQALADARRHLQAEGAVFPRRVVLVSSLAAAGPCAGPQGKAEDDPPAPVSAYGWSKLLVEHILGRAWQDALVILRPPIIYGSGDKGLLPVFKGVAKGFAVSPGAWQQFPVSAVHVSDMVQALMLSCHHKASGLYHLDDGATHSMDTFCQSMARALGRQSVTMLHLPLPLMATTAGLCSLGGCLWDRLLRVCGGKGLQRAPNWNLDKYREATQAGWLADASRIRQELGYTPAMPLDAGMAEAVAGYRALGWLPVPPKALPQA